MAPNNRRTSAGTGVSTSFSLFDDSARKLNNPENDSREKDRPIEMAAKPETLTVRKRQKSSLPVLARILLIFLLQANHSV